jgi:hypothetical protein
LSSRFAETRREKFAARLVAAARPGDARFTIDVLGSRLAADTRSVHEIVCTGLRVGRGNWFLLLPFRYAQLLEIKASLKLH